MVKTWNVIPRWIRNKISYRMAFKAKLYIFWPIFAKKGDVTPYKKSKNWSKYVFFKIIRKGVWIDSLGY